MNLQKGFSIVEWIVIFGVAAIITALLVAFIIRTDPNNKNKSSQDKSAISTLATEPTTHKVPFPDGFKSGDVLLKPGATVSTGVITFKYLGLDQNFYLASPSAQVGTKYVKVDFELKRSAGSGTFDLIYYPTVVPKKYTKVNRYAYGSVDYGMYDPLLDDDEKIRNDPLTGEKVKSKKIKVANGQPSYERVFGAHNHNLDENYNVHMIFEVPKDDEGLIRLSIDLKPYQLLP